MADRKNENAAREFGDQGRRSKPITTFFRRGSPGLNPGWASSKLQARRVGFNVWRFACLLAALRRAKG